MSETSFIPQIPANLNLVAPANERPRYVHDCNCCHFLGRLSSGNENYDLYAHTTGTLPTVIARFGDDGPEYSSGACASYGQIAELTEARRRAQALGLWEYNVREALFYSRPEFGDAWQELLAALPFTLEYQAFLAHEAGKTERHEALVRHLVALEHARELRHDKDAALSSTVMTVQQHISRVVAAYRGMNARDAMFDPTLQSTTEFLWNETLAQRTAA